MFAILAHIRPLDLRTNTRVDVRVASTPGGGYQGLGGFVWESAMTRRPKATIELFDLVLAAGTRTATAEFEINLDAIKEIDARALHWKGAPVILYRADSLAWPLPVEFSGIVSDPKPDLSTDRLSLSCSASTAMMDKPLLTAEFGDTDLTFDPDRRTVLLPAGFGVCPNIGPTAFDTVRNFYLLDGYGNLQDVSWLGEGLSSMGPRFADYPTYAALKAAADNALIPPGRWASCLSRGIVALGAPPAGTITCHATFGYGMTGALMRRALITHAGVAPDVLADDSFVSLDASVPYPVHYWTESQIQVKDLVEAMAAGCNAAPIVTLQGSIAVVRPFGGPSIGRFVRRGFSEPAVSDWKSNDVLTPYWKVTARVARPVKVMTLDEINYEDALVDRGLYDPTETYRQGNIVWLRNKSEWLYSNVIADKGHAPPDGAAGDAWWTNMAPAPGAQDLRYADGTVMDTLQPAEADAQITRAVAVSDTTVSFTLDSSGNANAGQFPRTVRATMTEANYDVTLLASWSIVASAGILASIDNGASSPTRGQISITNVSQAGTIQVTAMRGNTVLTAAITITTKGALADKTKAGTTDLQPGLTSARFFTAPDVGIGDVETTLIETPSFMPGDETYGQALAVITFVHDSSTAKDTAAQIRVYLDDSPGDGTGYVVVRSQPNGLRTSGGDTFWAQSVTIPVTINSPGAARIKVTVQGIQLAGGGNTTGSFARYARIDLFQGAR